MISDGLPKGMNLPKRVEKAEWQEGGKDNPPEKTI